MTLPCGTYVARAGIDHPALALPLLAGLPPRWSSGDRSGRRRHIYEFTDGVLTVDPVRPRRIDVHIRMRTAVALPALCLRRRPLHMAARGDTVAWGRKPRLAPGFGRRFHGP